MSSGMASTMPPCSRDVLDSIHHLGPKSHSFTFIYSTKLSHRTLCEDFLLPHTDSKSFVNINSLKYRQPCEVLGAEQEGPCTHRSPEKPEMLSIQDRLSKGKDEKPVLPTGKLRTGSD